MTIGMKQLLWLVALAGVLCMAVRAILLREPLGILAWPVLLGFGADRARDGSGVSGGTIGGLLGFGAVALTSSSGPGIAVPALNPGTWCLALAAGACWGFYLSVWVYIIVETMLQYR
jgi:hypothetical protein